MRWSIEVQTLPFGCELGLALILAQLRDDFCAAALRSFLLRDGIVSASEAGGGTILAWPGAVSNTSDLSSMAGIAGSLDGCNSGGSSLRHLLGCCVQAAARGNGDLYGARESRDQHGHGLGSGPGHSSTTRQLRSVGRFDQSRRLMGGSGCCRVKLFPRPRAACSVCGRPAASTSDEEEMMDWDGLECCWERHNNERREAVVCGAVEW